MRSLSDVQAEFAAALRGPATGMPAGLTGPDGEPAPRRFAVYRNNVMVGLVNALASAFPVVERIVGAEFFQAMARAYVATEPPLSPVLLDYGATMADFIAGFAPASSLPYLADVARIERAWRESYHAADATPLRAADLGRIGQEEIADLVLRLHPSLRMLRSVHPAQTIWKMHASGGDVVAIDMGAGENTLILRPDADVEVRTVPPGGGDFIEALRAGAPLGEAAAAGAIADERFDLAGNLAGLIGAGAIVGISGITRRGRQ